MNIEDLEALNEKLKTRTFYYIGSRPDYTIHDVIPNVLVLDRNYKRDSLLGWNLDYYEGLKADLINDINRAIQQEIKFYTPKKKLKIYRLIKERFPFMSNFIRRYKKSAITEV